MSTEVTNNVPANPEAVKEEVPAEKVIEKPKEEVPATGEKGEETAAAPKTEAAPPKPTTHKANYEKDIVYLYQFSRTPMLPSTSAYCLKVETWMRLVNVKYEVG